jgi:hypothetical protein
VFGLISAEGHSERGGLFAFPTATQLTLDSLL